MSGQLNPDEPGITATDDPAIARRRGWTDYDRESGAWSAPKPPDAGQRDGEDVEAERHDAALDEGNAQHLKEHGEEPPRPVVEPVEADEADELPVLAEDGELAADEAKTTARKRR